MAGRGSAIDAVASGSRGKRMRRLGQPARLAAAGRPGWPLVAVAVAAIALAFAGTARAEPTAQTQDGRITGIAAEGMREFLGIRYAAPPVGPLRWQPPQPVPADLATKAATAFASHCPQLASPYGVASTSEDCLFLNVYTPDRKPRRAEAGLPVMVWIHGGALVVGESDGYDPIKLVTDGDVIVVTINYRLGYLGFLAEAGLDAEGHAAANYGLLDQQFALDWVRRNIAGFGGNPENVTIFGESAGGLSVLSNLASPTAHGLFNKAIVESGAYALELPSLADAETGGNAFAAAVGCSTGDAACLRQIPVEQILQQEAVPGLSIKTIVDGTVLPLSIDAALPKGRFNRVPVMNGSNHDEYRLFTTASANLTAEAYPATLDGIYGDTLGTAVAAEYPVGNYAQPVLALAAAVTDQVFACTAKQVDRWTSRFVPTYAYEFADPNAPEDFLPPAGYPFGAAHASEIQYLFTIAKLPGTPALTPAQQQLSSEMVAYWTSFARNGSPNGEAAPDWAPYARGDRATQSLVPPHSMRETNFSADHHCRFWRPVINPPPS